MTEDFERLRLDVEWLRGHADPARAFGALGHRFVLNPPLSEAQVASFETTHNVTLPREYRLFLLHVGDGGAGPHYGVFRLGEMDEGNGYAQWRETEFVGTLALPFPHSGAWNDLTGEPNPELAAENEARYQELLNVFERRYFDPALVNGAIPVCHLGCALRQWLVISGPEAGYIWCDYRADGRGLCPLSMPGNERVTFFHWYRGWLDEALLTS